MALLVLMVIIARVRLMSPILGELNKDKDGIRRFKKSQGGIAIDKRTWLAQFTEAARVLGIRFGQQDTILFEAGYYSPCIRLYRRIYSKVHVELFEAIQKGTVLTLEFTTTLPLDRFRALFETVGKHLGISQFGSKFGFGRFEILDIGEKCNEQNSSGDPVA